MTTQQKEEYLRSTTHAWGRILDAVRASIDIQNLYDRDGDAEQRRQARELEYERVIDAMMSIEKSTAS